MSTSPSKKSLLARHALEGSKGGPDEDGIRAREGHIVTRERAQAKVPTVSSSDKENQDATRDAATALPTTEDVELATPLL